MKASFTKMTLTRAKKMLMRKLTLVVATICLGICAHTAAAQTAQGNVPKMEDVYKNIQVMKGLPADQMLTTMRFIRGSLGVACTWCHVEPGEGDAAKADTSAASASKIHPGWYAD